MGGMSNDPDGPPLLWLACAFVVTAVGVRLVLTTVWP